MLQKKILSLSLIVGLGYGLSAQADAPVTPPVIDTGSWLLSLCTPLLESPNPAADPNTPMCVGYVRGVIQSWYTGMAAINPKGATFWISEYNGVSSLQSATVVASYIKNNPHDASNSAVSLIIRAINATYPMPSPGDVGNK